MVAIEVNSELHFILAAEKKEYEGGAWPVVCQAYQAHAPP